ncbi:zinc knuckle CX2CX4HX4C containing protein, partial [Tanacetum coccineum]
QPFPINSSETREGVQTVSINDENTIPIHTTPITEPVRDADENNNATLGSDARLKQSIPRKVQVSILTNNVKVLGVNVAIPITVVDEICDKFANTLYGYFIGERLAFPIMEAYVNNAWANYRFKRAIFCNGFFFFKFSSQDGMVKTLEGGPWFIRSLTIVLNKWSANSKLKREKITRVPVWVRIHNVPVVAFSKTGLSLITTQLGRPMMLDASTSNMCINPWGHNSYARVLVEFSSECEVMESIVVKFFWIIVDDGCPSKVKKACSDSVPRESGVRDAGTQHKKKGANKAANKQGFRVTKPNNLIYRPVSKPSTINENTSKPNSNIPPSNKDVNGAAKLNVSHEVLMNDSSCTTNDNGYFKDDIDLGQLKSNIEKLMDEDKSRDASMSQHNHISDSDESKVKEVCMPFGMPGGGFLDDLEDDLDCYDGYEAQVYDLTEQEQAFCDRYDICLNSRYGGLHPHPLYFNVFWCNKIYRGNPLPKKILPSPPPEHVEPVEDDVETLRVRLASAEQETVTLRARVESLEQHDVVTRDSLRTAKGRITRLQVRAVYAEQEASELREFRVTNRLEILELHSRAEYAETRLEQSLNRPTRDRVHTQRAMMTEHEVEALRARAEVPEQRAEAL